MTELGIVHISLVSHLHNRQDLEEIVLREVLVWVVWVKLHNLLARISNLLVGRYSQSTSCLQSS